MTGDRKSLLPAEIAERLAELPERLSQLSAAMSQFGDDFDRELFVAAAEQARANEAPPTWLIERGFEIVQNYFAELAMLAVEAAGLRTKRQRASARVDFELMRDAGVISKSMCETLCSLRQTRNELAHAYVEVAAEQVHQAVVLIAECASQFMASYHEWMQSLFQQQQ